MHCKSHNCKILQILTVQYNFTDVKENSSALFQCTFFNSFYLTDDRIIEKR